jgi:hypothetical protein
MSRLPGVLSVVHFFGALWIANLVSLTGTWMHEVGTHGS